MKRTIKLLFSAIVATVLICGCRVQRDVQSGGKAVIITVDTTYIYHSGELHINKQK